MPYNQELEDRNNENRQEHFRLTNGRSKKFSIILSHICLTKTRNLCKSKTSITTIYDKYKRVNILMVPKKRSTSATMDMEQNVIGDLKPGIFGRETTVYMTLSQKYYNSCNSGTQATASINKCFQIYKNPDPTTFATNSNLGSTSTMSTFNGSTRLIPKKTRYSEVYFFGKKKDNRKHRDGTGQNDSKTSISKSTRSDSSINKFDKTCSTSNTQVKTTATKTDTALKNTSTCPSKPPCTSNATGTSKTVSIKDDRCDKPCPALAPCLDGMMVTVSHIKIGPKETCPIHGVEPCQGPKCIVASSGQERGQVKITTANNPRRGVFELVVRKLTGAPLARNEIMLEWTPPPCQPTPCANICPVASCLIPKVCPSRKCKLVVCQAACKPKRCRRPCKTCGPSIVHAMPRPRPLTCKSPCSPITCGPSQTSTCCMRLCKVGRRKASKSKSRIQIKAHKVHASPCSNRAKTCPVVQNRCVPGPCIGCCSFPPCLPRKCSKPCGPVPCYDPPCRPIGCCKSACGLCCK